MTNHNKASETSGEAEIQRWELHIVRHPYSDSGFMWSPDPNGTYVHYSEHAETIKRLVAERDAARASAEVADLEHRICERLAEAAEKRIAELEAHIAELGAFIDKAAEGSRTLAKKSSDLLAQVTELSADFKREEFHRAHWKNKAAELEADLQRAREALVALMDCSRAIVPTTITEENSAEAHDMYWSAMSDARAALKGKQL